jgi:peptidoglycan-associated lipoprotein
MHRRLTALSFLVTLAPLVSGCAHTKPSQAKNAVEVTPAAQVAREDAAAASAQPCGTVYAHFELDSAAIQANDNPALEGAVACLRSDRDAKIIVEGNTDERGTEEYNLALGERRAATIAMYLKAMGASAAQVHTVSYGENRPVCREHNEGCWAKNRRTAIGPDPGTPAAASREPSGKRL